VRISVIVPCHNAAPWIAEALRSAAQQSYLPHEIIVIDDASTDDSIAQIRASGVDVRLLHSAGGNAAAARNRGLEAATGDWIAFLDADDVWYPHHLSEAARLMDSSKDVAYMANFDVRGMDNQIRVIPNPHPLTATQCHLTHRAMLLFLTKNSGFGHSTVILRRDRVMQLGMFDETQKRRHDTDLWLRVLREKTWTYNAKPAEIYRLDTPGCISSNVSECEYFFLRALLKNRQGYEGTEIESLIRTSARRGMSLAFLDGNAELYQAVRQQAWPYLSWSFRLAYLGADVAPFILRAGIHCKRKIRAALFQLF
jgi:glycosyltransferase involved in cell wall biosynthesis